MPNHCALLLVYTSGTFEPTIREPPRTRSELVAGLEAGRIASMDFGCVKLPLERINRTELSVVNGFESADTESETSSL